MNVSFLVIISSLCGVFVNVRQVTAITCHCGEDGGLSHLCKYKETCTTEEGGRCYVIKELRLNRVRLLYGCLLARKVLFQCSYANNSRLQTACCESDMCNLDLAAPTFTPTVPDERDDSAASISPVQLGLILGGIAVLLVICIVLGIFIFKHRKTRKLPLSDSSGSSMPGASSLHISDLEEMTMGSTSGSGAGLPLLVQRTIARQVSIQDVIGQGRYGEVYRGKWRGEDVAVKKFVTRDEQSWFREAEIYQTVMLRHDNILGFIATDNIDVGTWTELWLVAEYHENGSLFDYLAKNKVDIEAMLKLSVSIASGLIHLHMEICGTQGKPSIAHRDLKSKNILVKKNGECAIADLGLAVRHDSTTDTIDIPLNNKVGTKRYMAPEVLNDSLNILHFDSFKKADIYALGLVLWEIARRCDVNGQDLKYELPYFDCVPDDPSVEEMKVVVCDEKRRPLKEGSWEKHETMEAMWGLMQECWFENETYRLSALRVKKSIVNMQEEEGVKA